jgi:hypothetical protein
MCLKQGVTEKIYRHILPDQIEINDHENDTRQVDTGHKFKKHRNDEKKERIKKNFLNHSNNEYVIGKVEIVFVLNDREKDRIKRNKRNKEKPGFDFR